MRQHDMQFTRNGHETTPGGTPRYKFWFGVDNSVDVKRFGLFKFNRHRTIVEAPETIAICFKLSDFVKTTKNLGLNLTKKEKDDLKQLFEAE